MNNTSRWVLTARLRPQFRMPAVRNAPELRSQQDAAPPVQLQYPGSRAVATFEATEAAASVVFRTVASVKAILLRPFLANVSEFTFTVCYRPPVCRLSVVCNVRAPYSGGSNFRQYFYGIRYLGHPLTSAENFMEIVPGKPLRRGS